LKITDQKLGGLEITSAEGLKGSFLSFLPNKRVFTSFPGK
jgi:hypothetical protein